MARGDRAGERGLEPLITEPESAVLPITPLPTERFGSVAAPSGIAVSNPMRRPSATPAASSSWRTSSDPPVTTLSASVRRTPASPSSSAISRLRSEWYGSVTISTSSRPRCAEQLGDATQRLVAGRALVLAQDRLGGHAALDEVGRRRLGLGEPVARPVAAGHHDERGEALRPQLDDVVEAGGELRRRVAVVLRRAHHHDGVDGPGLVAAPRRPHLVRADGEVAEHGDDDEHERPHASQRRRRRAPARAPADRDRSGIGRISATGRVVGRPQPTRVRHRLTRPRSRGRAAAGAASRRGRAPRATRTAAGRPCGR